MAGPESLDMRRITILEELDVVNEFLRVVQTDRYREQMLALRGVADVDAPGAMGVSERELLRTALDAVRRTEGGLHGVSSLVGCAPSLSRLVEFAKPLLQMGYLPARLLPSAQLVMACMQLHDERWPDPDSE